MTITDDSRLGLPSASGMERIMACAGSFQAEAIASMQGSPALDGGRDASKGTELHAANQSGDVSDLEDDDAELITKIRSWEEAIVTEWLAETGHEISDVTIYRELRMWNDHFSGQADMMAVNRKNKSAICLDLKTGRKKVSAPARNWQLRSLAVLIFTNFDVETVRTAIIQPFAERHSACEYTKEHLETAAARIKARLEYVRAPGLPRTAGEHCFYCKALPTCKEAQKNMSVAIQAVNTRWDLSAPADKLKMFKAATLANACALKILELCKADLAADPSSIPGLVQAKPSHPRSIKDLPGVVKASAPDGLNLDPIAENDFLWDWIAIAKVSVGDLEKFLMEQHSWTKKIAKDWIAAHPALIVEGFRAGKIDVIDPEPNLSLANRASGEPATPLERVS